MNYKVLSIILFIISITLNSIAIVLAFNSTYKDRTNQIDCEKNNMPVKGNKCGLWENSICLKGTISPDNNCEYKGNIWVGLLALFGIILFIVAIFLFFKKK